jgi:hypothetical protein
MTRNIYNPSKMQMKTILYQNADATQQTSRFTVFQAYHLHLANGHSILLG